MQYPVPQFTDVEDKIIGPLTVKQFGIMFGAGVVIFLTYSATKSILVLVFFFLLIGGPALGLAFANVNGRPLYNTIGLFIKFFSSPKVLIFHKEVNSLSNLKGLRDAQTVSKKEEEKKPTVQDTRANLKKVQQLLRDTSQRESDVINKNI
jgi:hypothetical protein